MNQGVSSLIAALSKNKGFAPSTKYKVVLPPILPTVNIGDLDAQCVSVTIPGFSITTTPRKTNTLPIEMPTGFVKDECTMVFIESGKYNVSKYFDWWMERIVNRGDYTVKYRREVVFDVFIIALEADGKETYLCRLINAFPKMKTAYNYAGQGGEPINVTVTLEYEDIQTENLDISAADLLVRGVTDIFLDGGFELSNAVNRLKDKFEDVKSGFDKLGIKF